MNTTHARPNESEEGKSSVRCDSRRGVAIIIVLGMIAVLTLAAVAFSISMRVERKGASNFRDGVQARQMLWAALANAVEKINDSMDAGGSGIQVYPDWDILTSLDPTNTTQRWPRRARVLSRTALDFVPGAYADQVNAATSWWNAIDISGQVRGRYAFIAVNCSGLLDCNYAGGTNRGVGGSANEIQLAELPDFTAAADVTTFVRDRGRHKRYETVGEFAYLNTGWQGDYPESFDCYSMSREDTYLRANGAEGRKAYIGTNMTLWSYSAITNALYQSGVPGPSCRLAYSNLLDYADGDSVPRSLSSPCVEAVPMINEVIMQQANLRMTTSSNFQWTIRLGLEGFYPFVTVSTNSYRIASRVDFLNNGGNPAFVPQGPVTNGTVIAGSLGPGTPYFVYPIVINQSGILTNAGTVVDFYAYVSGVIADASGRHVDEVPSPYNPPTSKGVRLQVRFTGVVSGFNGTTNDWSECVDPRFNWNPDTGQLGSGFRQWYPGSLTRQLAPGSTWTLRLQNNWTTWFFNPAGSPIINPAIVQRMASLDLDDDAAMYVRNKPPQSVGELGYICYDFWRTLRLYDHRFVPVPPQTGHPEGVPYHTVVDAFTTTPTNSPYAHGRVNLNTANSNVLTAVLLDMPEDDYNTLPSNRLSAASANLGQIVDEIMSRQPYTNVSGLGRIDWPSYAAGGSEIAKESFVRNSAGLLTTRHNLFTIIITADSYSPGIGGDIQTGSALASARAVAQVWRDPLPLTRNGAIVRDGRNRRVHRWFVRFFKIIDE